ncbi:DsbA family protein [Roseicella aerolata]|uniref:DsbA family protein n=1 Tax=Roseicella aerolata TaxID=2883479 RepID=A0A9X1I9Q3_9PROT|nr:DsbA family protein [Roseicella aerolata]MCB4820804.1 DsbA family protein [Roseicella aerolata]
MMRPSLLALLAGLAFAPAALAQGTPQGFTPEQRQEIIGILREALRQDPNILREALMALEQADLREREGAQRAAIAAQAEALFRNAEDPVKGNPQGAVTVVEFFDARCGYCKQLHPVVEQMLRRQRDVRLVLKDLPILGPNSLLASRALLAAQRQGKYAELHDALLRLREEPTEPVLKREAEKLGLDWARLRREMEDPAIARRLEANTRLASVLRIEGTPALIIGETLVPGAVDLATLERLVAEAREKRGG